MTITSIEAIPFALPRRRPVRFSNGEVRQAEHVLVRVRADDGAVGVAEASPRAMTYGDTPRAVVDAFETTIGPLLIGADERHIEGVHAKLKYLVQNITARAALDVALWDLKARRAGVPVWELLGGYARRVKVSHLLGLDTPQGMAEEAASMAREYGVKGFKVKVGVNLKDDVARTLAVREAVGDDAVIYLDANHGWTAEDALTAMKTLDRAQANVAWLEEPNPAAESVSRRWLVERLDVPVVADESAPDLQRAASELRMGHVNWIAIKTGRTGFTFSRQITDLCLAEGASVVTGSQIEGRLGSLANLHFTAAFGLPSRHPAELTSGHGYSDDVVETLPIVDGWMEAPEKPGLGLEVDEARLNALRLDK